MSLLPVKLQDLSNLTLEKCAQLAFDIDLKPLVIFAIDFVDARYLPLLAEQFHVLGDEGWNFAKNEKQKRDLLKIAFKLHRHKGTKQALINIFKTMGLEGKIEEWYEYNGAPYYFKVVLKVFDRNFDEETQKLLLALIYTFKNERSWLEKIEVYLCVKTQIHMFSRMLCGEVITIKAKKGI